MNGLPQGQIRLVIVGATGMVGGYALRYGLDRPSVGVVTVISRSTLGISHPKLKEVLPGLRRLLGSRAAAFRAGCGFVLPGGLYGYRTR